MKLLLIRKHFKPTYTIGKLYLDKGDGNGLLYFCDTLEDVVRNKPKVWGKTAIPAGEYEVEITYSPRFKRLLPLLKNVPEFEGVRIHAGNTAEDTHGCILVGVNDQTGRINKSRAHFDNLFNAIKDAQNISIEIR